MTHVPVKPGERGNRNRGINVSWAFFPGGGHCAITVSLSADRLNKASKGLGICGPLQQNIVDWVVCKRQNLVHLSLRG